MNRLLTTRATPLLIAFLGLFVVAHSTGPKFSGLSGGPGESTCHQCHGDFPLNDGDDSFSITTVPPATTYMAGTTVTVRVEHSGGSLPDHGFQLSVRDNDGNSYLLLDTPLVDSNTEFFAGDRRWVQHNTDAASAWTVEWTPSGTSPPLSVTFYAAGVDGDGSGSGNDYVYTAQYAMTLSGLPVELAEFTAVADGNTVGLNWWTASETSNSGFEVRQKKVGVDPKFRTITFLTGNGTTPARSDYSYRTDELSPGRYFFRLRQIDFDGTATASPQVEVAIEVPGDFYLSPAYPNPFNPRTNLELTVDRSQHVNVVAVDALGRQVATLYNGQPDTQQTVLIDFSGIDLPSGIYFVRAQGETFTASQAVTLLK